MSTGVLSDIVTEYLEKEEFRSMPSMRLALRIYTENRLVFKDPEHVRRSIRYVRGASGSADKARRSKASHLFRSQEDAQDSLAWLPEGLTTIDSWKAFDLQTEKCGILSDVHIPFHSRQALEAAVRELKEFDPDTILINGDLADFYSISRWITDPRKRNLKGEIDSVRLFLEWMRGQFPRARIIFKLGNHDERWDMYIGGHAQELAGVSAVNLSEILHLKDVGVELVRDKKPIRAGKLWIMHGHEWKSGIAPPVNPARGLFLRAKDCVLAGHWHQPSCHVEKTVGGRMLTCWSTGCLSELHPAYCPLNNWAHGWARLEVARGGGFQVSNRKMVNGQVFSA